jgi:anti-sigma factor RsiW
MAGILNQLGNDEAILLMYLADELPREDRTEVDRRLSQDASLRAEMARLRGLQDEVLSAVAAVDETSRRSSDEAAIARVMRRMKQHQVVLAARGPAQASLTRRQPWPWWVRSVAAAAAVVFLLLGLWGVGVFDGPGVSLPGEIAIVSPNDGADEAHPLADLERSINLVSTSPQLEEADQHMNDLTTGDDVLSLNL